MVNTLAYNAAAKKKTSMRITGVFKYPSKTGGARYRVAGVAVSAVNGKKPKMSKFVNEADAKKLAKSAGKKIVSKKMQVGKRRTCKDRIVAIKERYEKKLASMKGKRGPGRPKGPAKKKAAPAKRKGPAERKTPVKRKTPAKGRGRKKKSLAVIKKEAKALGIRLSIKGKVRTRASLMAAINRKK